MYDKPQIKPHFNPHIIEEDKAVFLISEQSHYVLQGELYFQLVPLLNGKYTVDQIIDILEGQASIAEIYYALTLMENKGYITEANTDLPHDQLAFWSSLGMEPGAVAEKLQNNPVAVLSLGKDQNGPLESILTNGINPYKPSPSNLRRCKACDRAGR